MLQSGRGARRRKHVKSLGFCGAGLLGLVKGTRGLGLERQTGSTAVVKGAFGKDLGLLSADDEKYEGNKR